MKKLEQSKVAVAQQTRELSQAELEEVSGGTNYYLIVRSTRYDQVVAGRTGPRGPAPGGYGG